MSGSNTVAPAVDDAFDDLERQSPEDREARLLDQLRQQVAHAKANTPHYAETLSNIDLTALTDRAALGRLPIVRKHDLIAKHETAPPFGGLAAETTGQFRRLFLSPGPICEAEPAGAVDSWRMARALFAAGFRAGDALINTFSYHHTPAGFMFDAAAAEVGCAVFPGGVGQTEQQVLAIRRFGLSGYVGTPDFLKIIIERADELETPITTLTRALVTGGPLFPNLRQFYADRGITVRQCYGTAELGLVAFETADPADGLVVDEGCIVEIVRPGTGDPVAEGEVGEVVVTTFDPAYPLIRLATGDLSALLPAGASCGRTNVRLKGWLGRADQTAKVRGMFVHPEQLARVRAEVAGVGRLRLVITEADGRDVAVLQAEVPEPGGDADLIAPLEAAFRTHCRVGATVELVAWHSLPNDGKVIDDQRTHGTTG